MYPAPIEAYFAPKTIEEALGCLAEAGDGAMFIAGGMSLMQAMKARRLAPRALIDLNEVEELSGLAKGPRGVTVRPLTRYRELTATSALHGALQAIGDAAATVGDRQVRNAGTIGGSLCWNYVASCMPNVCLCLDATLVLASLDGGERTVPIEEFLVGPLETARRDDELLIEINFPSSKHYGVGSAYKKYGATVDGLPDHRHRGLDRNRRVRALHRRPLQRRRYSANRPTVRRSPRAALRPTGQRKRPLPKRPAPQPMQSRRRRTTSPAPTIARC